MRNVLVWSLLISLQALCLAAQFVGTPTVGGVGWCSAMLGVSVGMAIGDFLRWYFTRRE